MDIVLQQMSASIYLPGRNQQPTVVDIDKVDSVLADMLSKEESAAESTRFYIDHQPKSRSNILPEELIGKTLVVLGEGFRSVSNEEIVKPMTLYLRQSDGKTLKTYLRLIDSVFKVKQLLVDKFGVAFDQWRVQYKGQQLNQDFHILLEHHVVANSIIHCIRKTLQQTTEVEIIFANKKLRTNINIGEESTIRQLKEELQGTTGLEVDNQILIYCGGELLDGMRTASYDIAQGGQIFMVNRGDRINESRANEQREKKEPCVQSYGEETHKADIQNSNTVLPLITINSESQRSNSLLEPPSPIIVLQGLSSVTSSKNSNATKDFDLNPLSKARVQYENNVSSESKPIQGAFLNCKRTESIIRSSTQSNKVNANQQSTVIEAENHLMEDDEAQSAKKAAVSASTIEAADTETIEAHEAIEIPSKDHNEGEQMRIMISRPNGIVFAEEIGPDDSIQSLKVRIESNRGFPIDKQVIKFDDNTLEGSQTVRQIGWKHDALIQLVLVE